MNIEFPSADPRIAEIEFAAEVLNRFHWNISVEHAEGEVRLRGGELLVARFPTMQELEVFTAGMALTLSLLPDTAVAAIDQFAGGN
jgi:hypothetical protein